MSFFRRKKHVKQADSPPQGAPVVHIGGKVFPAKVLKIHRNIAERMGTGFLYCDNCTRVQELSVDLVERYLRDGWPVCCHGVHNGGPMRYYRAGERKDVRSSSAPSS